MLKRIAMVLVASGFAVAALGAGQGSDNALRASLNGNKEIDGGDANGRGTFRADFNGARLCYTLRFSGLENPMAAHIHRGRSTQNGAIVVDLRPRFDQAGARRRCVAVPAALRRSIRRQPAGFYVNVHTQEFPDGAIRGQLSLRR